MNYPYDIKILEDRIGYHFTDRTLVLRAVTHSSYANENRERGLQCNERLEFFGDSVLSLVVSEHLFNNYTSIFKRIQICKALIVWITGVLCDLTKSMVTICYACYYRKIAFRRPERLCQ